MSHFYNFEISRFPHVVERRIDLYSLKVTVGKYIPFVRHINFKNDIVSIFFSRALNSDQEAVLNSIIDEYVYTPPENPPISTNYEATVSDSGDSDFKSISEAFKAGKKSVFVKNGIYNEIESINIPDRGQLIGETQGGVYINFGGHDHSVKIVPHNWFIENRGVISIESGTDIVNGVGTQFLDTLFNGCYILISSVFFKISRIVSNVEIVLDTKYFGSDIIDEAYVAQTMCTGNRISNIIVANSLNYGINCKGVRNGKINSCAVYNCGIGYELDYCGGLSLSSLVVSNCQTDGLVISNSKSISINTLQDSNNGSCGIKIKGNCENVNMGSCTSENNGVNGCVIESNSKNSKITDCIFTNNRNCGIVVEAGVKGTILSSGNFVGGKYGINSLSELNMLGVSISKSSIAGLNTGDCDNLIVTSCNIGTFGIGIILENVTSAILSNNIIHGCGVGGLNVSGSSKNITVCSNIIRNNDNWGFTAGANVSRLIINGNMILDNSYEYNGIEENAHGNILN